MRLSGTIRASRIVEPVSHIDLFPTLMDIAGGPESPARVDGTSLVSTFNGKKPDHPVFTDYLAIGPCVPCRMVRSGTLKYMYTHGHQEQLFDLSEDPHETNNLANEPVWNNSRSELRRILLESWNPEEVDQRVRLSQRRRMTINSALGSQPSWDYVYRKGDSKRFVRTRKVDSTKNSLQLPPARSVPPNRPLLTESEINNAMQSGMLS